MANMIFVSLLALVAIAQARVTPLNDLHASNPELTGHNNYMLAIGGTDGELQNAVYVYDEQKSTWATGQSLPYVDYAVGVSHVTFKGAKHSILVTGGDSTDADFSTPLATCLLLNVSKAVNGNPVNVAWEQNKVSNMNTARVAHAQQTLRGDHVYVFGGETSGTTFTATGEVFNAKTNKWTYTKSMPSPARGEITSAALGEDIYIIGGYDGSTVLTQVDKYNAKKDTWTSVASLNTARLGAAAVSHDGKIYAAGGQQGQDTRFASVEVYDPKANTWTFLSSPMNTERAYLGFATTKNGTLLACGGVSEQYYATCEGFDVKKPSLGWTFFPSMPLGITALSFIAV